MRGTRIQNIVDELNGEKIDVVEWSAETRQFINNALSPARPTDSILIEEGDVRTAIVVVPDRQLSLAIGKEGQNARLAAKLTGWRIDIKSETEAATEGLSEIKRQQLQMIKARSLTEKAATAPGDDLLSRAEWLLREKDKSAVTLEQAAAMLAEAGSGDEAPAETAPPLEAAPVAEDIAAPAPAVEVTSVPEATAEPEAAADSEELVEPVFTELDFGEVTFDETETDAEGVERAGKSKKTSKKRELVYDERLGQVVSRKKRKPGRSGWYDDLDG
jgi:hypothetical protein